MLYRVHAMLGRELYRHSQGLVASGAGYRAAGALGIACSMVYMRARELNPRRSPARIRFPASQFSGESGALSDMSARMAWHMDCNAGAEAQGAGCRAGRTRRLRCRVQGVGRGGRG